jgi:hypothetical protein
VASVGLLRWSGQSRNGDVARRCRHRWLVIAATHRAKGTLAGLVPFAAVALMALAPSPALAAPHWYKNGALLTEGAKAPFIEWGTIKFTNAYQGIGSCRFASGGHVANPPGGGAGELAVLTLLPYGCEQIACESLGGHLELAPLNLTEFGQWTGTLIEPEAGSIRLKIGNREVSSTTKITIQEICAAAALRLEWHGELRPKVTNGSGIGAAPSKLVFDSTSGELESLQGGQEWSGKPKLMGYESQEILGAKNP